MAQKAIREFDAKRLLAKYIPEYSNNKFQISKKIALVTLSRSLDELVGEEPWIKTEKLVVKPDQQIGKRGKLGLILLNATFEEAKKWINERMDKTITIGQVEGQLTHFLVEPFTEHDIEYYLAIKDHKNSDHVLFSTSGGVDIEENLGKVITINVPIDKEIEEIDLRTPLSQQLSGKDLEKIEAFIKSIYKIYKELNFTFLELNPFTIVGENNFVLMDTKGRLDDTALFWMAKKWGGIEFPVPFGRSFNPEESYIKELDNKTGASLKLMVLNPEGRLWTMVAGGGASIIYTDTIVDLGYGEQLANYGEYSGNPSRDETYEYAKTILDLMTRKRDPRGKILIIGGGIANFTDIAITFQGIIKALRKFKGKLIENNVKIYVRRGGPNFQEGLKQMKDLGREIGIPIEVHGPEMHLTRIVKIALEGGTQ
ncbi:MAG: ATPase [Candidatus Helarchaeota archaeon]|nr:ATPase [Candidatus Helarchaeota archaeon]